MTLLLGKEDLAKYPFLNEAGDYIKQTYFDLDEFDRPEFNHVIEKAKKRIESEILKGIVCTEFEKYDLELFAFLISLIIIKYINIESITKKYSLFEAMRVEKFLTHDLVYQSDYKKRDLLISKIFHELLDLQIIQLDTTHNIFKMKISDYLSRSTLFHEQEWKLINRSVNGGFVFLDVEETVRLVRNELSLLIYKKIMDMKIAKIPEKIKIQGDSIKQQIIFPKPFKIRNLKFPPCIDHAIDELNKNENLSHSARFLLATYMLSYGKSINEIIQIFKNAPDYNEQITRYQVEHLAGKKGSMTKYSVPSCSKLANEHLCYYTDECKGITNPTQFGIKRLLK